MGTLKHESMAFHTRVGEGHKVEAALDRCATQHFLLSAID